MLKLIWSALVFEILILLIIKPFVVDFEFVSILAVSLNVLFTMILLLGYKNKYKTIFLFAFLARVGFMVWDLYARNIFTFPNSGADTEAFYHQALLFSEKPYQILGMEGELYSKIIGLVFYLIGPQRMFGQYINVLLGLSIVFLVFKILMTLEIKPKVTLLILLIAAFFPNSLIMSSIFLREIITTFFVTLSLFYFIKWIKKSGINNMLFSLMMIGVASMFHSGVIGIAVGYAFMFLFYKKDKNAYRFSIQTALVFLFIVVSSSIVFTHYQDVFLGKFNEVEGLSDIYSTANTRLGGSAYLTGVTINNPLELLIYGPVKALYFLISPLPMNWRGFMDIFTFLSDSILYFTPMFYFIKNKRRFKDRKSLIIGLIVTIVSVSLIFGIGVGNAGTAARHRHKLIPLFLVLLAVMLDTKNKFKK